MLCSIIINVLPSKITHIQTNLASVNPPPSSMNFGCKRKSAGKKTSNFIKGCHVDRGGIKESDLAGEDSVESSSHSEEVVVKPKMSQVQDSIDTLTIH